MSASWQCLPPCSTAIRLQDKEMQLWLLLLCAVTVLGSAV